MFPSAGFTYDSELIGEEREARYDVCCDKDHTGMVPEIPRGRERILENHTPKQQKDLKSVDGIE